MFWKKKFFSMFPIIFCSFIFQDLVAWLTLGTYHIPRSEDIPNVPTPETELSFMLTPFNYFPEDPSVSARNAVRLTPNKEKDAEVNVENLGNPDPKPCVMPTLSLKSLKSSSIFKTWPLRRRKNTKNIKLKRKIRWTGTINSLMK